VIALSLRAVRLVLLTLSTGPGQIGLDSFTVKVVCICQKRINPWLTGLCSYAFLG
jgi:hypothetical protein